MVAQHTPIPLLEALLRWRERYFLFVDSMELKKYETFLPYMLTMDWFLLSFYILKFNFIHEEHHLYLHKYVLHISKILSGFTGYSTGIHFLVWYYTITLLFIFTPIPLYSHQGASSLCVFWFLPK